MHVRKRREWIAELVRENRDEAVLCGGRARERLVETVQLLVGSASRSRRDVTKPSPSHAFGSRSLAPCALRRAARCAPGASRTRSLRAKDFRQHRPGQEVDGTELVGAKHEISSCA